MQITTGARGPTTTLATTIAPDRRTTGLPADAGGEVLRVEHLRKTFGDTVAVDDVSFSVTAGRVVGLVGANGAGKTTTINCVAGLQLPDSGQVLVCGESLEELGNGPGAELGLSGQETSLYPELSSRVNLEFFGELLGMTDAEIKASVGELTERMHLGPLLDERVRYLSGGQRQLIHIAASLVHRPRVVLLDEPSTGLDPRARAAALHTIQWVAGNGAGVLFSSHRLGEVEEVCDEVIVLHRGRVVAAGPLDAVIAAHGQTYVELVRHGSAERHPGVDVGAVLATVDDLSEVESVTVVRPSLEAVFFDLTGVDLTSGEDEA